MGMDWGGGNILKYESKGSVLNTTMCISEGFPSALQYPTLGHINFLFRLV